MGLGLRWVEEFRLYGFKVFRIVVFRIQGTVHGDLLAASWFVWCVPGRFMVFQSASWECEAFGVQGFTGSLRIREWGDMAILAHIPPWTPSFKDKP